MRQAAFAIVLLLAPLAVAQTPPARVIGVTREADPGVSTTPLLDREEMRASRLDVKPGGTRRVHQHDDVLFHLFIPASGSLRLTRNGETVDAFVGQVYFLDKGTPHGFANVGASNASAFEVFIKPKEFTTPARAEAPPRPTRTTEVDPGVFNTSPTMDRVEMYAGRVEVKPGGTRRVHQHNEVRFHVFIPITGSIRATINGETMDAALGQLYFLNKGTPHTFTNTGDSAATAVEVFIKARE